MQIEPYVQPGVPAVQHSQPLPLTYYATPVYEKDELSFHQLFGILRRRIWVIAGVAVAVTGSIWAWTFTRPAVYESSFQLLVEPVTNINRSPEIPLFGSQPAFDYATQIQVMRTPEMLAPTVEALKKLYPEFNHGELAGKLAIAQVLNADGRNTKILAISYRDLDPKKVKTVLDQLAKDYLQYSIQLRQASLQQGVLFVEERLPELQERVTTLQKELESFRKRYSLVNPESRGADISEQISSIEKQSQETNAQLQQMQTLYATLQSQLGEASPTTAISASSLSESPRYQKILNQIQEVEAQIAAESARFQTDSPNIQALIAKRQQLLPLLDQESQRILGSSAPSSISGGQLTSISLALSKQLVDTANQVQVLQARSQALAQTESTLKKEFALVPSLARQYTDLQRELGVATESLNRFLSTREDLQIEAAQRSVPWQLIVPPIRPGAPISPNIPRNLVLGLVAGSVLGLGAALLAEKLDNVFHSASDLKDSTRLPLLAIIPFYKSGQELAPAGLKGLVPSTFQGLLPMGADAQVGSPDRPTATSQGATMVPEEAEVPVPPEAEEAPVRGYVSSPFRDSFRSLYTNIRFLGSDEPIRSLVISSAVPADGKSTVAFNLAQAAAALGQRVLLVDTDLRRPQIHVIANLPNIRGISNVISANLDSEEVIQQSSVDENLFILTSGQIPPDPTKLLSSKRMQSLMDEFKSKFDLVIYDTPPLLGLADSSMLAGHTDGLVMVVGLGRTDRSAFNQAIDALKMNSSPILGIVANGIKGYTVESYYQQYYYHRYYSSPRES